MALVEEAHAEVLAKFNGADLIGFHGQTTSHRPEIGETHQAGNGALLAEALGVPVVWDFRSADMKLGGQGAPLASFYHFALAQKIEAREPLAFLNIGGVSNLTWLDPNAPSPDSPGACLAFDCGPGNAKMDDAMLARRGTRMDADGELAAQGVVHSDILNELLENDRYFSQIPPKSLDRDAFQDWLPAVVDLSDADAMATLAAGTVQAIVKGLAHCPMAPERLLVTGGGRKNPDVMRRLTASVSANVLAVEDVGFDGDMLEAQAFAFLAVRVFRGLSTSAPGTTGVPTPGGGGQISRPGDLCAAVEA